MRQEVSREADQLLRVIFKERRKTGRLYVEASQRLVSVRTGPADSG
jgi:hypothetical protein